MIAKKINVSGTAISPGLSKNGILYTADELKNFAPTLSGKPILKDHKSEVDGTVGLVETGIDNNGSSDYAGWIKEDGTGLIEKIQDRRIKEVSIGAFAKRLVKEKPDSDYLVAVGLEAMELSLTPTPAMKGTSCRQSLAMMENAKIDKTIKVLPILETIKSFAQFSQSTISNSISDIEVAEAISIFESYNMNKEDLKMEKTEEQLRKEIEEKVRTEAEAKKAEEAAKIVEAQKKDAELRAKIELEVKEKLALEEAEKAKEAAMRKEIEDKNRAALQVTKGKVNQAAVQQTEHAQEIVVEKCEFGNGFSFWKQPNSDGTLN